MSGQNFKNESLHEKDTYSEKSNDLEIGMRNRMNNQANN